MYQRTIVQTRPTAETEFFNAAGTDQASVEFINHWVATYRETGKLLLIDRQFSPDKLTRTTVFFWDSEESYNQAVADPVVIAKWALRDAFHASQGIVTVSETGQTI